MYQINKGINRSVEFKGIKAQYIIYLGLGLVLLLLLFVILYMLGVSLYICLGLVIALGICLYMIVATYSKKYGEHGLQKHKTAQQTPRCIQVTSRHCFIHLSEKNREKESKAGRNLSHLEN